MTVLKFSSVPDVQRDVSATLASIESAAGFVNFRGEPSTTGLLLSIYFAFKTNPARAMQMMNELRELSVEAVAEHTAAMNARKGPRSKPEEE